MAKEANVGKFKAVDQHGVVYTNLGPNPRKALMTRLGASSAWKASFPGDGGQCGRCRGWVMDAGKWWITLMEE